MLRVLQLTGAVYLDGAFFNTVGDHRPGEFGPLLGVIAALERVISFHLVTEGPCMATPPHNLGSTLRLNAGTSSWCRKAKPNLLRSSADVSPELMAPLLANQMEATPGEVMTLGYGVGGAVTRMICGFSRHAGNLEEPFTFRAAAAVQSRHAPIQRVLARIVASPRNRAEWRRDFPELH